MKNILITGANGFIGKNFREALLHVDNIRVYGFDVNDTFSSLEQYVKDADIIYHFAGVNRPRDDSEFIVGNVKLTKTLVDLLNKYQKKIPLIMTSSTQAGVDNAYGVSKRQAEEVVFLYGKQSGAEVFVYRLTNVFGKWSLPNYNSVVSTFCYNISHGLDITIPDADKVVELVYIDDVIYEFLRVFHGEVKAPHTSHLPIKPTYTIKIGALAEKIYQLRDIRKNLVLPDLSDNFTRYLHATFLSYFDVKDFSYPLDVKSDHRGCLAELIKSKNFGQIFVSKSYESVIRGNHYHNTKIEKFCVLQGEAVIKFRNIFSDEVLSYNVSGDKLEIVDIPPGYTHSIENLGHGEIIVLFWANEIFNPQRPDTFYCEVEGEENA